MYTNHIWEEVNPYQHFLHYRIFYEEIKPGAVELAKPCLWGCEGVVTGGGGYMYKSVAWT